MGVNTCPSADSTARAEQETTQDFTGTQINETSSPSGRRIRRSLTVAAAIGIGAAVLGLAVLAGWTFNIQILKSVHPGWATMKANTALGFVFAGATLCLLQRGTATGRILAVVFGAATVTLGAFTLIQYFTQFDFGIDQAVFDTAETTLSPGRPAPITAFNFVLLGAALILLDTREGTLRGAAQLFAIPALALSYLALLGYIVSANSLYDVAGFSSVALHTAVGQTLLGIAVMASSPETGITRMLLNRGDGSRLARRLVVLSVILFPVLGWLRIKAEETGVFSSEMGVAFLISVTLAIFLAFILLPLDALIRAEVERERLSAVVHASKRAENTFRDVLNAEPDGMLVVNRSGEIVMANTEVEKLFGYAHDELMGSPVDMLLPVRHQHAHATHRETFWRNHSTRPMSQGSKLVGRRQDGSEVPVEIALSPVQTEQGDLVIGSIRDISERLRFYDALSQKNVELERASKAKDYFLANMSHELRTPLTIVIGFVKTLMMKAAGPLNAEQERNVSKIETNATHLLSLLNDLLDLAKVESGSEEISLEPVDLRSVVEEVETSLRPLAEGKGLALEIDCPPRHTLGSSNRRTLIQILLNLTNNSIKFTTAGSVRIVVEGAPGGNRAITRVHVVDTGIGIRPEDHEKLFQPFTQLGPNAIGAGTGLGLHLSRSLARSLGGDVTFRSVYGLGSTFTLILREQSKAPDQARMPS